MKKLLLFELFEQFERFERNKMEEERENIYDRIDFDAIINYVTGDDGKILYSKKKFAYWNNFQYVNYYHTLYNICGSNFGFVEKPDGKYIYVESNRHVFDIEDLACLADAIKDIKKHREKPIEEPFDEEEIQKIVWAQQYIDEQMSTFVKCYEFTNINTLLNILAVAHGHRACNKFGYGIEYSIQYTCKTCGCKTCHCIIDGEIREVFNNIPWERRKAATMAMYS